MLNFNHEKIKTTSVAGSTTSHVHNKHVFLNKQTLYTLLCQIRYVAKVAQQRSSQGDTNIKYATENAATSNFNKTCPVVTECLRCCQNISSMLISSYLNEMLNTIRTVNKAQHYSTKCPYTISTISKVWQNFIF